VPVFRAEEKRDLFVVSGRAIPCSGVRKFAGTSQMFQSESTAPEIEIPPKTALRQNPAAKQCVLFTRFAALRLILTI
jgi:hypothetical protein